MSQRGHRSVPSSPQPEYYWDIASESSKGTLSSIEETENEANDDIDERTRRFRFLNTSVCLYQAALRGDWSAAKDVLDKYPEAATYSITRQKDTVLHIAAAAERTDFVKELVRRMNPSELEIKNKSKKTAICYAAASGIVAIAEEMVNKNNKLPLIGVSNESVTPLYMAALHGRRNMVSYLYSVTPFEHLTRPECIDILVACISTDLYDMALKILKRDPELATMKNKYGKIALQELAKKPDAIGSKSQLSVWERCLNFWPFKVIYNKTLMRTIAHQLVDLLWENVRQFPGKEFSGLLQNHSSFLFDAAISGNVEFLIILIRSYPDLIWSLDKKKRSIFHIAIIYRQESVFNLIYELGAIKDIIALYTDKDHNNMLHLAAEIAPPDRLNIVSGAALKLQRELLWFKEIEKIVQPSYRKKKNIIDENKKASDTPWELFTKTHENLHKEGEKWMKDTANYGMLVAALIATVVFAAAFTVPGGNNQELGTPILLRGNWFLAFFISDAIALLSSSTSILTFLSILTSRYAEKDFLLSLPARLLLGLATLFISIASMVVAFSATCFLRTQFLQEQINQFNQRPDETFQANWEKFKDLVNICPHHGFESWRLVSYFYIGLTQKCNQFVQTMCNGEFFCKEPDEALSFFDYLAESAQQWNTCTNRVPLAAQPLRAISGGGRYELKEDTDVQARIAALTRRLEVMEMEKVKAVKVVEACSICADSNHKTQDCPIIPVFQEGGSEQMQSANWVNRAQNQPFSNTYNPGWRNHPNFSWRNDQPGRSPPPAQQPFHQGAPQHQYPAYQSSQSYHFVALPGFQPHVTA